MTENYYWSDDFSAQFYMKAAECGFITTSMYTQNGDFVLLPEIQFEYAVLNFDEIIINKKIKKLIKEKKYIFSVNNRFEEVLYNLKTYHKESWINDDYIKILKKIKMIKEHKLNKEFKLLSIEVCENETKKLISGEIGYKIGKTYTSLSGFTTREKKYNNWGKLQLVLLNDYLKENGYKLWNLGHPQLQYKIDLGAKIYNRNDFLAKWREAIK
jgi:Leu/Phe-tRNA-protein transferase